MRCGLGLLLVVLIVLSPDLAWGRSEQHRYREIQRIQKQWQREVERIHTLQRRGYPYFRLDVF